ncbi:hypothetical protein EDB86DRAFT_2245466 [Lactarius hatsudake]|nr:hypothetical protein EDB86DRAFT_2245466 [Lactarius hatsudake]
MGVSPASKSNARDSASSSRSDLEATAMYWQRRYVYVFRPTSGPEGIDVTCPGRNWFTARRFPKPSRIAFAGGGGYTYRSVAVQNEVPTHQLDTPSKHSGGRQCMQYSHCSLELLFHRRLNTFESPMRDLKAASNDRVSGVTSSRLRSLTISSFSIKFVPLRFWYSLKAASKSDRRSEGMVEDFKRRVDICLSALVLTPTVRYTIREGEIIKENLYGVLGRKFRGLQGLAQSHYVEPLGVLEPTLCEGSTPAADTISQKQCLKQPSPA